MRSGAVFGGAAAIDRAIEQGMLVMIDATETLHMVTAGGVIDWDSLKAGWRGVIAAAGAATGQPQPRVAAFSETGALLIAAGHVETAMRMEAIAEELIAAGDLPPLDLTCVYRMLPPAHSSFTRYVPRTH